MAQSCNARAELLRLTSARSARAFPKCLGAVANINMSGLPTSVVVDTAAGTVAFTGYQPPSSTLSICTCV